MDTFDKFLESLSLDADGLQRQFMSFSSIFNILLASAMGFLVLAIYMASSGRERRDRNLYTVIPVLSVLMAVMMRIEGPRAISFFGIFGIMSLIRFRSDITDQRGITFILFAVIEGVIVGVNAYLLAILAWVAVSASILIGRYLFGQQVGYRLVIRVPASGSGDARESVTAWFKARGVTISLTGLSLSSEQDSKNMSWEEKCKADFILFPKAEPGFLAILPQFFADMKAKGIEVEMKRQDAS
jgi:hypothetical protein